MQSTTLDYNANTLAAFDTSPAPKVNVYLKASLDWITLIMMVSSTFLNALNTAVFIMMSLADVMNLCLFTLSVCDGISSAMASLSLIAATLTASDYADTARRYIDIDNLWGYLISALIVTQLISTNVTSLVAVERCLCVVVPFKVKKIVTLFRTRIAVGFIVVFSFAMNIPCFYTVRILRRFNPVLNVTRVEIVYTSGRFEALHYINTFVFLIFDPLSIILVVATCVIMVQGLRRSARFRQTMKTGTVARVDDDKDTVADGKPQLSANNIRLVKMLLIVAAATTVIHFFSVMAGVSGLIEPEFITLGRYAEYYALFAVIFQLCYAFNMGMNTFVYFHYNTKFRNALIILMPCFSCFRDDKLTSETE